MILYPSNSLTDGLAAWYGLESVRDSQNRNALTNTGGTFAATGGKPNGKVTLSLATQSLSRASGSCVGLDFAQSFSYAFWANVTSAACVTSLLQKGGTLAGTAGYRLLYTSVAGVDHINAYVSDGVTLFASASVVVNGATWNHYAVTVSRGGVMTVYLNGVSQNTTSLAGMGSAANSGQAFNVQALTSGTGTGVLSSMGLWSRALTATEVRRLYRGGSGLAYPFNF